ncbi:unnamed protein product [Brassica rapa subsp. narinosa]
MNPKTLVMNLLILLLVQISNLSVVVNSLEAYHQQYYHRSEFRVPPNSVVRIVISNDLFGLKNNGNAGFVCTNGNGVWRKSKPGDRYVVAQFKYDGKRRQASTHCHLRSRFGFVNFPVLARWIVTVARSPVSFRCFYDRLECLLSIALWFDYFSSAWATSSAWDGHLTFVGLLSSFGP